ncbi:MAG: AtzG-like protein [Usitatibacter sp.]
MADTDVDDYIARTAQELGIGLSGTDAQRTRMVFANLERLAKLLEGATLADDAVAAAVFRPGE